MNTQSIQSIRTTFAVTIAFAVAAPILLLLMLFVEGLAGSSIESALGATGWLVAAANVSAFAGFAGLLVDMSRLLARLFWRKKIPYRLKLHKVLKQNLV